MKHIFLITLLLLCLSQAGIARENGEIFSAEPAPRTVILYGFTRPRATMTVVSEVSGKCLEVLADMGEKIGPDGLLARIDPTFIRLELEENKISREQAASRIAYLQKELKRFELLFSRHSTAESQVDKLSQELNQAELKLKSLENNHKILAERLERHAVRCPPGWQVIKRFIEPGEWLNVGQPLAELGDFQTLIVPFALSSPEYKALRQQENISLLTTEGKNLRAEIYRVSPDFEPKSRKINLDLVIADKLADSRGGIKLELRLDIAEKNVFAVPAQAVIRRYGENLLQRESGETVAVVIHGSLGKKLRVGSALIRPGDHFILNPLP